MKGYLIYAKPLRNNLGNEPVFISKIIASSKGKALYNAITNPENSGLYNPDSFFAIMTQRYKIHLEDGSFFETRANGNIEEVQQYFVGNDLNRSTWPYTKDVMVKCISIEPLGD